MKKVLIMIFAVVISVGLFLVKNTYAADELTYQRAYEDYVYNMNLYRTVYSDYQLARSQYLQSKTLNYQSNAQEKTVKLLQTRDDVVITYLTALRMNLSEVQGISDSNRNIYFNQIDSDVSWFQNHKDNIPSAGTLEDLVGDSNKASEHYSTTTSLVYKSLAAASLGRVVNLTQKQKDIISALTDKINQISQSGDKDTSKAERWLIETNNRITRNEEKISQAQASLDLITPDKPKDQLKYYNDAVFRIQEAKQFLKEANDYIKEIIKELKTAD